MQKHNIIAVVMCGGQSSRMGVDKSQLNYHGVPQMYYLYKMLRFYTQKVIISCNKTQKYSILSDFEYVVDLPKFENHGPISGLLSVHEAYPDAHILLLGCDYPFITSAYIQQLIEVSSTADTSACYVNTENFEEPLIAIYHNKALKHLHENFQHGEHSLFRFLRQMNTQQLVASDQNVIKSIDTMAEYEAIVTNKTILDGHKLKLRDEK
jgi:molybdopterin-guanine dinucleotide biosynthesis protein A